MKKILGFFAILIAFASCKTAPPVQEYTNQMLYFYVKPITLDTTKISDQKDYLLEANTGDGAFVLSFVKGNILREILRLDWKTSLPTTTQFPGRGFTANDLKEKSILPDVNINQDRYDEGQLEMIQRNKNVRKFQIVSSIPINVCGIITLQEMNSRNSKANIQVVDCLGTIVPVNRPANRSTTPANQNANKKRIWKNGAWVYQ